MLTRRERLMATLKGESVDRPPVSFYEIGGFKVDPANTADAFNIYSDPSWQPLLQLAEEKTDLIRLRHPATSPAFPEIRNQFLKTETYLENGSRFTKTTITVGGRILTSLAQRDPEVDTVWTLEHLLKSEEDAKAYLQLPDEVFARKVCVDSLVQEDQELGENGIIMVDVADPICVVAPYFSMEDFTVTAYTEHELFHRLLEQASRSIYSLVQEVAEKFPGHLWRIYGPEYATEPYLPTNLFEAYVVQYTGPMVQMIQCHGGFVRVHCHGRIRDVLPYLQQMNVDAIDPIEPPPQGNVELAEVRQQYGKAFALFGNLEIADIENMEPAQFEKVVAQSIEDGTSGEGRGFVLMPSAAPYGRNITSKTMANYETMVRLVGA